MVRIARPPALRHLNHENAHSDGLVIIWMPTDRPVHTFGADAEEAQYEKEHWKPKIVLRYVFAVMTFASGIE